MIYKSQIIQGDARTALGTLEDASIDCVVTSPPYWGLRDYGTASWNGGDDGCDHVDQKCLSSDKNTLGNGRGDHVRQTISMQYKSVCGKCGALRIDNQIGLESTPEEYVDTMVKVFSEVSRVLKPSGTLWLNLGDSYAGSGGYSPEAPSNKAGSLSSRGAGQAGVKPRPRNTTDISNGLKAKDLCGIPWRVAFALQADGWYLRQEIIWSKPNPMPESVKDRCTKAHESIFLLAHPASKGKYSYDADAIREKSETQWNSTQFVTEKRVQRDIGKGFGNLNQGNSAHPDLERSDRNKRSVWNINLKPYSAAHFATFPPELPRTCILAGTSEKGVCPDCGLSWVRVVESKRLTRPELPPDDPQYRPSVYEGAYGDINGKGDAGYTSRQTLGWQPQCDCGSDPVPPTVLDPFAGAGTTLMVANQLQRHAIGVELNPDYAQLGQDRIYDDAPLFNGIGGLA